MQSCPVVDATELDHAGQIRWRLSLLQWSYDEFCRIEDKTPTKKSQLAADDRVTGWVQLSHQVKGYLNMAADSIRAILEMLLPAGELQLPLQAHYPLIRTALEAAAYAKWILEPDSQIERVRRSISGRATDLREDSRLYTAQRTAILLYDPSLAVEMERADAQEVEKVTATKAELRRIAETLGIEWGTVAGGAPGTVTIMGRVGAAGKVPGEYAASVWKILSGLSHPSASRFVHHAHIEELSESEDGVVHARITASLNHTHQGLLVAQGLFLSALELYKLRMLAPHVE
jgi:hypothetical protein